MYGLRDKSALFTCQSQRTLNDMGEVHLKHLWSDLDLIVMADSAVDSTHGFE